VAAEVSLLEWPAASPSLQQVRAKAAEMRNALEEKAKQVGAARNRRAGWGARSGTISSDLAAARAEVERLESGCVVLVVVDVAFAFTKRCVSACDSQNQNFDA
jgi:hypothetical protein